MTWGEYEKTQSAEAKDRDGKPRSVWRRTPRREDVRLALGKEGESETPVPDSGGLVIHALERGFDSPRFRRGRHATRNPGGLPSSW